MQKTEIKELGKNFAVFILAIILFLLFFELTLRIFPGLLGQTVENQLLTKYHFEEDGIFFYDLNAKTQLMKPDFETNIYFNGYYWNHKTDSRGFRNNKEYETVDILLLGDSIIYGHGVEQNQTVGHFMEKLSDYSVYNTGVTGYCMLNEKYVLSRYGKELKPKYVFYFFFENDLQDLNVYLTEKQMKDFVFNTPLDDFSPQKTEVKEPSLVDGIIQDIKIKTFTGKAVNTFIELIKNSRNLQTDFSLEWQYTEKAIQQMDFTSKSIEAELIIVPLTNDQNQLTKLEGIAEKNNIQFFFPEEIISFEQNSPIKKEFALKYDRHLNEKGHKKLAEILLEYLKGITNE